MAEGGAIGITGDGRGRVSCVAEEDIMAEILLIEDMAGVRHAIRSMLKRAGHNVTVAETGEAGVQHIQARRFDLVVTDLLMPGLDGSDVIHQLKEMPDHPPVIAISGGGAGPAADKALKMARDCADAFFTKPFETVDFLATVDRLLRPA